MIKWVDQWNQKERIIIMNNDQMYQLMKSRKK